MNKLLFYFFTLLTPTFTKTCDIKILENKLQQIQLTISFPFDSSLEKKISLLKKEASLLKKGTHWKEVNQLIKNLKTAPEYKPLEKLQEALNLLNALEDLSLNQPQPELLDAISSLLQSSQALNKPCRSFFQKERARLMDGVDESILIKTKQNTILKLKKSLLKELEEKLRNIKTLTIFKKLKDAHQTYMSDKKTKKIKLLIEKIKALEQERYIQVLTNKEYLDTKNEITLLLTQNQTPPFHETSLFKTNTTASIQLSLFVAPLDIIIL